MAQVKKLQSGGTATKKTGTIRKDGRTLSGTEAYDWLASALTDVDPSSQADVRGAITTALNNGHFVDIGPQGIDFYDVEGGNNLNGQYKHELGDRKAAESTDSNLRKNFDALLGNRRHKQRQGFEALMAASMPNSTSGAEQIANLTALGKGNSDWWEYGSDNKYINSPGNMARMKILDDWANYFAGDDEAKKGYSFENWTADTAGAEALRTWGKSMGANAAPYIAALKEKIQSGAELNDEELAILKGFGFNNGAVQQTAEEKALTDKYHGLDIQDSDWKNGISDLFGQDANGNLVVNDAFYNVLGMTDGQKNAWFNNYWKNTDPRFDFLKDKYLINGRIYNQTDNAVADYLNRIKFAENNKAGNYSDSDLRWMWGNTLTPYSKGSNEYVNGYFQNGNMYFDPTNLRVSGTAWDGGQLNDGDQILRYYDPEDIDQFTGLPTSMKYAIMDRNGNVKTSGISEDAFTGLYDGTNGEGDQKLGVYKRLTMDTNSPYYNRRVENISTNSGSVSAKAYIDANNPNEDVYLELNDNLLPTNNKALAGKALRMPRQLYDALKDSNFWSKLAGNAQLQSLFRNSMRSKTKSALGATDFSRNLNEKLLNKYGVTDPNVIEALLSWLNNNGSTSGWSNSHRREGMVDRFIPQEVVSEKQGGEIPKFQHSGLLSKQAGVKGVSNDIKLNTGSADYTKSSSLSEIGDESTSWTNADSVQLATLALDMGGLAASFAPVFGPAMAVGSGLIGMAGDIYAKAQKHEKGIGKAVASGLGLSALAAIPGGKIATIAPKAAKLLPKAIKLGMVTMVTPGAVNAASKLINGEKVTLNDWREIANGMRVGADVARTTNFNIKGKKGANYLRDNTIEQPAATTAEAKKINVPGLKVEGVTETPGNIDVEFTPEILSKASGLKSKEAASTLREFIGKQGDTSKLTDEAILKAAGFDPTKKTAKVPKEGLVKSVTNSIKEKWGNRAWDYSAKDEAVYVEALKTSEGRAAIRAGIDKGEISPRVISEVIARNSSKLGDTSAWLTSAKKSWGYGSKTMNAIKEEQTTKEAVKTGGTKPYQQLSTTPIQMEMEPDIKTSKIPYTTLSTKPIEIDGGNPQSSLFTTRMNDMAKAITAEHYANGSGPLHEYGEDIRLPRDGEWAVKRNWGEPVGEIQTAIKHPIVNRGRLALSSGSDSYLPAKPVLDYGTREFILNALKQEAKEGTVRNPIRAQYDLANDVASILQDKNGDIVAYQMTNGDYVDPKMLTELMRARKMITEGKSTVNHNVAKTEKPSSKSTKKSSDKPTKISGKGKKVGEKGYKQTKDNAAELKEMLGFKNGGIIKAQSGQFSGNFAPSYADYIQKKNPGFIWGYNTDTKSFNTTPGPSTTAGMPNAADNFKTFADGLMASQPAPAAPTVGPTPTVGSTTAKTTRTPKLGGIAGKAPYIDPITTLSAVSLGKLNQGVRHNGDLMQKAIAAGLHKDDAANIEDPRNNTGTAGQAYFNAANQYRQAGAGPSVTSDARQNFNLTQQNFGNAVQQDIQGNLANSQQNAQYQEALRNTRNQRNASQTQVNNNFGQQLAAAGAASYQQQASTDGTITNNNHAWEQQEIQGLEGLLRQKRENDMALANAKASQQTMGAWNANTQAAQDAFKKAGSDFAANSANAGKTWEYSGDFNSWLANAPEAAQYRMQQTNLRNAGQLAGLKTREADLDRRLGIFSSKKGGSTSAYQKRTVQETQAIDAHKASLRAIESLDKDIRKMLIQLINM